MIKTILIAALALIAPIQDAIFAIGFLIMIDLIMGVTAAYKTGEKLKSSRLKNTGVKMLIYNLLLISSFIAQTYLAPWIPFTKIVLGFLATVEITSMGESFQKITGLSFVRYIKDYLNEKLNSTKDK